MGGNQTRSVSRIDQRNWVPILPNKEVRFQNVNNYAYRALRNIKTNEEIEQYHVEFISQSDYMQYVKELTIRKEPSDMGIQAEPSTDSFYFLSPFIYTVKYFLNVSMMDLCSTSYKGLLYAKKVDIRLKEINDIPLADELYMLRATLEGFKVLYEKMGYFDIIEEMIFIDKEGKVKVWVNPNLSHNQSYLIRSGNTREMHGSQAEMIVTLINLVEDNTDQLYEQEIHFREYLINKGIFERLSFHLALQELEVYCMQKKIQICDHMPSIRQLYHPETMIDEQSQYMMRDPIIDRSNHVSTPMPTLINHRSAQGKIVTSPVRLEYPEQHELHKNHMNESQTDKKSNYSTDNIYRSVHDLNQQSSRKVIVIPNSFRQARPHFSQQNNGPVQTFRGGSGVRQPVTINFPPKPYKNIQQEQMSFRNNPRVNRHTIINTGRISERVDERVSVERRTSNTLFKFNYTNKPTEQPQRPVPLPTFISNTKSSELNQVKFNPTPSSSSISVPQPVQVIQTQIIKQETKAPSNPVIVRTSKTTNRLTQPSPEPQITQIASRPQLVEHSKPSSRSTNPQVQYYTSDETYNLDSEIAEDLKMYLGYNPE